MPRRLRSFANRRTASVQAAVVFAALVAASAPPAWADAAADTIINKGIEAMGGEAKLVKAQTATSKVRGTFGLGDNAFEFTMEQTTDGLDRVRSTYEADFGGNKPTVVTVLDGDKGWRKEGETEVRKLEGAELAQAKLDNLKGSITRLLVPLKVKDLKLKTVSVGDEKVDGKPAAGVKVTGPDGKDFTIYFDKESGLPVKVIEVAPDRESPGQEFTLEIYLRNYEDFSGIRQPRKLEIKRDGQPSSKMELVDFKVLDKVDDQTFAKPEAAKRDRSAERSNMCEN